MSGRAANEGVSHTRTFDVSPARGNVFIRWRSRFCQSQLARPQKKSVGQAAPSELDFAFQEDTVLAKLDWYRQGGEVSYRQWHAGPDRISTTGLAS